MNETNRFISPTDDINRSGAAGVVSVNVVGNMNEMTNRTGNRLFQTVTENPRSSELIVSSRSRSRGSPFDFTTDMGGPLYRARTARLAAAVVPAIPNINRGNNEVRMQFLFSDNTVVAKRFYPLNISFTIPVGYYSPARFQDVFAALLSTAIKGLVGRVIADLTISPAPTEDETIVRFNNLTVSVTIDEDTFKPAIIISATSITINLDGVDFDVPGFNAGYWIDASCSFIERGIYMVPFNGVPSNELLTTRTSPATGDPSVFFPTNASVIRRKSGNPFSSELTGNPASFYYSRYITIISESLSLYTFGESRVDRTGGGGGTGKIIGVFATARYNGNANFIPYIGTDVIKNVEAPVLGINNAQLKLNELLDFRFEDEFGIRLDDIFPSDQVNGPTLAFNITY